MGTYRSNPAAHSTSITRSLDLARKLSCKIRKNDRATMSLLLRRSGSIGSALVMRCRLLRRSWSTLRLLYASSLSCPVFQRQNSMLTCEKIENEQRAQLPSRQGASPEQASALEESIYKLSAQLSTISRNQKYFRTRENRNFSTVRSTERRIFNLSLIESLMMISMAGLQVFVVRFFFQGARKGMFSFIYTRCPELVMGMSADNMTGYV